MQRSRDLLFIQRTCNRQGMKGKQFAHRKAVDQLCIGLNESILVLTEHYSNNEHGATDRIGREAFEVA